MGNELSSESRERVLSVAERLFAERGYASVTLRDIAAALGIRQASLYYHVPGGKEELFIAVCERSFLRHKTGLADACRGGRTFRDQLHGASRWLLSQPPLNLGRMEDSDMPEISPAASKRLMQAFNDAIFRPLRDSIRAATVRGEIRAVDPSTLAIMFLTLMDAVRHAPAHTTRPPTQIADEMLGVIFDGLRP
jgi:AcrR family transcriptional regulator